ncbi:hypothetical protein M9458_022885, partial [Cirrhinus mrigala]
MKLASGTCTQRHSPVHTGIEDGGVHPLIQVFAEEPHRDELNYPAEYALSKPAHHHYGFSFQDPASRLPTEGTELLTARIVPRPPWANRDLKEQFSLWSLRGISRFLNSIDGHDRCLSCLGLVHAEAAFVDGSCAHCEHMSMATLRRLPSSSSRGSSSSRKGFTAATARRLGDLQVTVQNVPLHRVTAPPPKSGPSFSFGAPQEEKIRQMRRTFRRDGAPLRSLLLRAATGGIGLEVPKVPPPDPSRLNDWFLGTSRFGEAQIDLFASPESSHCQLYYSLNEAPLGRDALAHSWPPGPNLRAQTLWFCWLRRTGPPGPGFPSLEDPPEEGPSFSGAGHNLAPASRSLEPARVASGQDTAVIETITQQAYALRWGLFVDWCASRGEDPQRCPIAVVLSFLQEKLERRLSPSTLKVYVAAIAAIHWEASTDREVPLRLHLVPSWDLSVALQGLWGPPFEPLVSVELKFLSLKTALLTALASIKRVGDLQAFSVNEACLEFGPADSHVVLRPRPGYVPKVPTTPFWDQVVNLQALPPEEADPALALLCPVRALRIYVDRTRSFRRSEQLFICLGGQQKGNAVSKQRLAHWVVDAISLSYEGQGEP